MHQYLLHYISQCTGMATSTDEEALIKRSFEARTLRKHQYFLQEGNVCRQLGFVVKGAMTKYCNTNPGAGHVMELSIENSWIGDLESIVSAQPSRYNIEAWENCQLLSIEYAQLRRLANDIPAINKMVHYMDEYSLAQSQRRLNATMSLPADYRYARFTKEHPEHLQRFPLHIIASYLGVKKETLSRIRKNAAFY